MLTIRSTNQHLAARGRPTLAVRTRPKIAQRTGADNIDQAAAESSRINPRFESKARRRELLNLLRVRNAAKHLDHLPEPGCTIHGIMRGNYSFCDLIPAVLSMIVPAKLSYVAATTLGFSQKAILQILDLIDSGGVARFDFCCADFFAKSDPEICMFARAELTRRGSKFTAARCHAKIILFATSDG